MRRITKAATIAATTLIAIGAIGASASAATVNPDGSGFIGKGEVQSAFGMNNGAIQRIIDGDVTAFTFRAVQPTTRSLIQDATQAGTQAGTQSATQAVTQSATQ